MASKNWWDNAPIVKDDVPAATDNSWYKNAPIVNDSAPQQGPSLVPAPDQGLQNDLNTMRDRGEFDGAPAQPDPTLQSQGDLYDPIRNKPEYQALSDWENSYGNTWGNVQRYNQQNPQHLDSAYRLAPQWPPIEKMPPELIDMYNKRADEMATKYANTGAVAQPGDIARDALGQPILTPTDSQGQVRLQSKTENNPNFDPSKPEGPDNPAMINTKYLVDPPDREGIIRMGYQVMNNIVGGVGDVGNDLIHGRMPHFTTEGDVGRKFPETVPSGPGEKFADDMATFIVGPKVLARPVKALGAGIDAATGGAGLAGKAAGMLSPSTQQMVRDAYNATLNSTGSAQKAMAAASAITKTSLVGLSFGLAEATVAPNGSQGLVSPEWLQKKWGVDKGRAQDISFALDIPIIQGSLNTLGAVYNMAANKFIKPTFGGLRDINVFGANLGSKLPMSDTTAGLKLFTWLDPNVVGLAPEQAAFNIKTMADALERNSVKNLQLAGVGKQVTMDTPAAFQEIARDYYKTAYAGQREVMGTKEFNDWIAHQADDASNRLFQLRTALNSNDAPAKGAYQIDSLFNDAADAQSGVGSLELGQTQAGQLLGDTQINKGKLADDMLDQAQQAHTAGTAKADTELGRLGQSDEMVNQFEQNQLAGKTQEAEAAKNDAANVIKNDPEMQGVLDQALASNPWGSNTASLNRINAMSEPAFESLKKMRLDTDAAYNKIAESGAEADPNSFLQIIRDNAGDVAEDGSVKITDPFLKKLADEVDTDSSFSNMYMNVKRQIQGELDKIKNPQDPRAGVLKQLRSNIYDDQLNYLKANGDDDVIKMVDDAKNKYVNYITTWRDNSQLKTIAAAGEGRMNKENFSPGLGPGQGVNDWKNAFQNGVVAHLDAPDQGRFMEALSKGVKEGGNDINGHIADALTAKSIDNLASSLNSGAPQSVATLRSSLKDTITGLEAYNPSSPLLAKYRELSAKLDTAQLLSGQKAGELQNLKGAIEDSQGARQSNFNLAQQDIEARKAGFDKQLQSIKDDVAQLRKEANLSVLKPFVHEGEDGARAVTGGTTAGILKRTFNASDSEDRLIDMMTQINKLGPQGDVAKDALKATYLDYIRDRLGSKQALGPAGGGNPQETAYRISEPQAKKIFGDGSKDMNNLKIIFHDQPEVLTQLEEAKNAYLNLTRKTPKSDADKVLTSVSREEDPQQALNSLITFTLGVLNPTSSRVRRLTGPLSVESLNQVRASKQNLLESAIGDASNMATLGQNVSKNILAEEAGKARRQDQSRAGARATSNWWNSGSDRQVPLNQEMENLLNKQK